jgi:hypothetical protein
MEEGKDGTKGWQAQKEECLQGPMPSKKTPCLHVESYGPANRREKVRVRLRMPLGTLSRSSPLPKPLNPTLPTPRPYALNPSHLHSKPLISPFSTAQPDALEPTSLLPATPNFLPPSLCSSGPLTPAPWTPQDTTRVWRALVRGCIPVTFFRATELPFARFLGLDYRRFVVNVQPDDYRDTPQRLARILEEPHALRLLQQGVLDYQAHFLWDAQNPSGVFASLDLELAQRATVFESPVSVFA